MTTTTTIPTEFIAKSIKDLNSWVRKVDRWNAKCSRLSAATLNRDADPAEYALAWNAWNKGGMPSKPSKYYAYGRGEFLRTSLNLQVERASSVDDLREIVRLASR